MKRNACLQYKWCAFNVMTIAKFPKYNYYQINYQINVMCTYEYMVIVQTVSYTAEYKLSH